MGAQRLDDQDYLRSEQYQNAARLSARIALHQRFSTNQDNWQRWLFERLQIPDQARILELGCGRGDLWLENRDRIDPGWQLTLTDFSPGMLETAQQQLAGATPGIAFKIVDAQAIPFANGSFDVVIANHMLYHVPDRPKAFSEIRRVLGEGGRFFAAANGHRHLQELSELIERHAPGAGESPGRVGFTLDSGAEQLRPWFAQIERHDYVDGLEVTEAEPLVAYILSTSARSQLSIGQIDQLRTEIAGTIAANGVYRISKETGLFSCRV